MSVYQAMASRGIQDALRNAGRDGMTREQLDQAVRQLCRDTTIVGQALNDLLSGGVVVRRDEVQSGGSRYYLATQAPRAKNQRSCAHGVAETKFCALCAAVNGTATEKLAPSAPLPNLKPRVTMSGKLRDAVLRVLSARVEWLSAAEIAREIGDAAKASTFSYVLGTLVKSGAVTSMGLSTGRRYSLAGHQLDVPAETRSMSVEDDLSARLPGLLADAGWVDGKQLRMLAGLDSTPESAIAKAISNLVKTGLLAAHGSSWQRRYSLAALNLAAPVDAPAPVPTPPSPAPSNDLVEVTLSANVIRARQALDGYIESCCDPRRLQILKVNLDNAQRSLNDWRDDVREG
jgi:DNA-binding transcriptional ArsR family regulator